MTDEQQLAQLLDDMLRDADFWAQLDSPEAKAWAPLGERAVSLYDRVWPLIEDSVGEAPSPKHHAVAVVRDMADAAAISARDWTKDEWAASGPRFPWRAVIELEIRLYDVDEWALDLGHALNLKEEGVPEAVWDGPSGVEPDDPNATVAENFAASLRLYDSVLTHWDDLKVRERLSTVEMQRGASGLVSSSRGSLVWGRGAVPEAEGALVAQLFIAESFFALTRGAETGRALFPSHGLLRSLIDAGETREWLGRERLGLPEWLE